MIVMLCADKRLGDFQRTSKHTDANNRFFRLNETPYSGAYGVKSQAFCGTHRLRIDAFLTCWQDEVTDDLRSF